MADDPVIFDDGGSTRIKKRMRNAGGVMDSLLTVQDNVPAEGRSGSQHEVQASGSSYASLTITSVTVDQQGAVQSSTTAAMLFQRNFEISSGVQRISGVLVPDAATGFNNVELTVHGPVANPPMVEAKQTGRQRRYVVVNAPPIDRVKIDGNLVYTADGNVVYTTVVVI